MSENLVLLVQGIVHLVAISRCRGWGGGGMTYHSSYGRVPMRVQEGGDSAHGAAPEADGGGESAVAQVHHSCRHIIHLVRAQGHPGALGQPGPLWIRCQNP